MNSTLKVPAPEIRTLIEKIKVDLRKRADHLIGAGEHGEVCRLCGLENLVD